MIEKKKKMGDDRFSSLEINEENQNFVLNFLKMLCVFIFINLSWLVFFSPSLSELSLYLSSLANFEKPFQIIRPFIIFIFCAGLFLQLPSENFRKKAFTIYAHLPMIIKAGITVSFLAILYAVSTSGIPPFIYFGF